MQQCPECRGKVSEHAPACPHCGCPRELLDRLLAEQEAKSSRVEVPAPPPSPPQPIWGQQWGCSGCGGRNLAGAITCAFCGAHAEQTGFPIQHRVVGDWFPLLEIVWGIAIVVYFVYRLPEFERYRSATKMGAVAALLLGFLLVIAGIQRFRRKYGRHGHPSSG